jgi:hypothetical protein
MKRAANDVSGPSGQKFLQDEMPCPGCAQLNRKWRICGVPILGSIDGTKSRHRWAGRGGDGFSQYETTDVTMWPRPKTYSRRKKAAASNQDRDGLRLTKA